MFAMEDEYSKRRYLLVALAFLLSKDLKIPFRFWSLDGARLECRQKYFNTKNSKGYASIQFLFHIEIPCTNWVFTMVKLGQICHF